MEKNEMLGSLDIILSNEDLLEKILSDERSYKKLLSMDKALEKIISHDKVLNKIISNKGLREKPGFISKAVVKLQSAGKNSIESENY